MSAALNVMKRMVSETVFELPMSKDYCRDWGIAEAAREIEQNAIDSDSPFEFELTAEQLVVTSRHSTLDARSLLLGQTTKSDSTDTIGRFGEGYKIALLVLAREGYDATVYNGDVVWRAEFRHSKKFGEAIFCVVQTPADTPRNGLSFAVRGLKPGDAERIEAGCLQMQHDLGEIVETSYGRILRSRPGKLYVGGLFVCDTKLKYGYDAKPEHLKLERDRKTVDGFNLQWFSKEMWFAAGLWDEIAAGIEAEAPDFEYAQHGTPELVKEACYKLFQEKHPGKVVARTQDELSKLVKDGLKEVVYVGGTYGSVVHSSRSYQTRRPALRAKSPRQLLQAWLAKHQYHIHAHAKKDMEALIVRAAEWKEPEGFL